MDWRQLYFSSRGRISLKQYWLASLPLIGAQLVADLLINSAAELALSLILSLVIATPGLVITVKRLHDRGRSGWFMAIVAVPVLGAIWLMIEAGLLPGVRGPNRFGPDPLQEPAADRAGSATAPV